MEKQTLDSKLTTELLELVKINSWSHNPQAVNQAGEFVINMLKDVELAWHKIPHSGGKFGDLLVARSEKWDQSKPGILLTGHLDTVFENHSEFDIRVEGGVLYGPGASDMKGGLLVIVEAIRRLAATGKLTNIVLMFTPEEENSSSEHFPEMKEILDGIGYGLVFEGEGSKPRNPDNLEKYLVVQRKGYAGCKLIAKAPGGHSGVIENKDDRHSAIHELIYQAGKILNLSDYSKRTTTNIGVLNGGTAPNALAENAEMLFDMRAIEVDEQERVLAAYEKLATEKQDQNVELTFELMAKAFPFPQSAANTKFLELAQEVGAAIGVNVMPEVRTGGSDANRIFNLNPNIAILDSFGPLGHGEHTVKDSVYLDSVANNIVFTQSVLEKLIAL